jgi:hypothetical protein
LIGNIVQNILGLSLDSPEAIRMEDVMRGCAQTAITQIRHEQIEGQSAMAFHTIARACKVMFRIGAAMELKRLGYKFEKLS